MNSVQHVFLIGAKSLGAYGGYETFINKLTEYHQNESRIKYHVACKANGIGSLDPHKMNDAIIINDKEFIYHGADCFLIPIPEKIGSAQAIYYDIAALEQVCKIIKRNHITKPIVYIMACRIGPAIKYYYKKIHKLGGKIFINPDGHEWMRQKWSPAIRKYWKYSERMMVKYSDLVICDSLNIEKYIHKSYDGKGLNSSNPKTEFIAYGSETRKSLLSDDDEKFTNWLSDYNLKIDDYYLIVGRFVPENNYETIIREFMKCKSKKDLAIITNLNVPFINSLESKLCFKSDERIKFVGTVYDSELLMKIRENAYGYFHGHEVGGTNPSLLEALGSTPLNLLLDVSFNREVAQDSAIYWKKEEGNLSKLIEYVETFTQEECQKYNIKAKKRIDDAYNWNYIVKKYEKVFINE